MAAQKLNRQPQGRNGATVDDILMPFVAGSIVEVKNGKNVDRITVQFAVAKDATMTFTGKEGERITVPINNAEAAFIGDNGRHYLESEIVAVVKK